MSTYAHFLPLILWQVQIGHSMCYIASDMNIPQLPVDLARFKQVLMIRKFQTAWIMTKLFSIEILVRIKQQEVPFPLRFKHMFFFK